LQRKEEKRKYKIPPSPTPSPHRGEGKKVVPSPQRGEDYDEGERFFLLISPLINSPFLPLFVKRGSGEIWIL